MQPLLEAIKAGATVITATARLAREIRLEYDHYQASSGERAWESSDVLPESMWFERCWIKLRAAKNQGAAQSGNAKTLVNDLQLREIWENLISNDIHQHHQADEPLWNIPATARAAIQGWKLTRQWQLKPNSWANSHQPDHQSFARWCRGFEALCEKNGWLDTSSTIDYIVAELENNQTPETPFKQLLTGGSGQVIWVGFDRITRQQNHFIEASSNHHIEHQLWHEQVASSTQSAPTELFEFADDQAQWLAAAHWAKHRLLENPDQRLAIVVPDLNTCREQIDYALSQTFSPQHHINGSTDSNRPYHLSLGQRAAHYPVVKAALDLLTLAAKQRLPYAHFGSLLRTPFLTGADEEGFSRSRLEMALRQALPFECSLTQCLNIIQKQTLAEECPALIQSIKAIIELSPEPKPVQTFTYWGERFAQILDQAGWPGNQPLNSEEYQTVEAFGNHLKTLASLDFVGSHVTAQTALGTLHRRLLEQPFQAESKGERIEVLGILEATGIQFDAIWFAGLNETSWPPPIKPSPFIPRQTQEQAGIHQSSTDLNLDFATTIQRRLAGDCRALILSRPCFEKDLALQPSPLFHPVAHLDDDIQIKPGGRPTSLIEQLQYPSTTAHSLEVTLDSPGLPISHPQVSGGTSLITDQSLCPFRAYAHFRLGARSQEPNDQGLDASDRGSIIHDALDLIWQYIRSLDRLKAIDDAKLDLVVARATARASQKYRFVSGCGPRFLQTQNLWLGQLIRLWLEIERGRCHRFEVVAIEKKQTVQLSGLELRFKIDRIDRFQDGSLAVIDYKTGIPSPLSQWLGPRPESPQLPLYAIAQSEPIEVVAFANLHPAEPGFSGLSHETEFENGERKSKVVPFEKSKRIRETAAEWDELMSNWYYTLTALADQVLNGKADIDPLNQKACDRCDLHTLCRIHEQPLQTLVPNTNYSRES